MVIEDTASAGSESRIDHLLSRVSILFVGAVWIPATVCAIFLFGGGTSWATPAAFTAVAVFLLLCIVLFRRLRRKELILIAALTLLLLLVSAAGCIFIKDTSFDGRWYHADAVLALLRGIDPLYRQIPSPSGRPLYSNHYPKATWYFAALTIHLFNQYQLGKIYNPLLILASTCYAFVFFGRFGMRGSYRWLLTLIVLLSPVPLSQWTTFCVDGALGSLLTIVIMATVALLVRPNRLDRILFVLSASLLVAIKFTGLVYVVIAAGFLIGGTLALKHRDSFANLRRGFLMNLAIVSAAIGLGVLVLGYDPYVTNLEQGHHLFYPLMGKGKVDVFSGANTPPQLAAHPYNRFQQFFLSLFSRAADNQRAWTELKVPFSIHAGELAGLARSDTRIEGWGVFFSGAFVACLILFLAIRGWRRDLPLMIGIALILVSTFSNPMCWFARYVPQLSLLPIFFLLPAFQSKSTQVRSIALMLGLILLANNFISAGVATGAAFIRSEKLTHGFETAAKVGGPGEYWAYRGSGEVAQLHYEQLSGFKGIMICGQVDSQKPLPSVGVFPIAIDRQMVTEVTLVKGSCSSGPPF